MATSRSRITEGDDPSEAVLREAHCWQDDDRVGRNEEMTRFRRMSRYQQARWRDANRHPMGTQPHRPRPGQRVRPVGSRLPLEYAVATGANLVTPAALAAARTRTSFIERHQSFDHQRLWADLMSSEALGFNLFGDVAHGTTASTALVQSWFPDAPGPVTDVRFAHSPGRLDPAYLNSLRAFDVAFVLDAGHGRPGLVAVDVKFHELMQPELPRPDNRERYLQVAARSGCFLPGAAETLMNRTAMCETWLEHLLMLSMLQHHDAPYAWARYLVIHPIGNVNVATALDTYREHLTDVDHLTTKTLEDVLHTAPMTSASITPTAARYTPGHDDTASIASGAASSDV